MFDPRQSPDPEAAKTVWLRRVIPDDITPIDLYREVLTGIEWLSANFENGEEPMAHAFDLGILLDRMSLLTTIDDEWNLQLSGTSRAKVIAKFSAQWWFSTFFHDDGHAKGSPREPWMIPGSESINWNHSEIGTLVAPLVVLLKKVQEAFWNAQTVLEARVVGTIALDGFSALVEASTSGSFPIEPDRMAFSMMSITTRSLSSLPKTENFWYLSRAEHGLLCAAQACGTSILTTRWYFPSRSEGDSLFKFPLFTSPIAVEVPDDPIVASRSGAFLRAAAGLWNEYKYCLPEFVESHTQQRAMQLTNADEKLALSGPGRDQGRS